MKYRGDQSRTKWVFGTLGCVFVVLTIVVILLIVDTTEDKTKTVLVKGEKGKLRKKVADLVEEIEVLEAI